jgi:hypothetical protein
MDGSWGKFDDFKDQMENLEQFMMRFHSIYLRETMVPESKLKKILKRNIYMDSKICLKYEIVDSVWGKGPS